MVFLLSHPIKIFPSGENWMLIGVMSTVKPCTTLATGCQTKKSWSVHQAIRHPTHVLHPKWIFACHHNSQKPIHPCARDSTQRNQSWSSVHRITRRCSSDLSSTRYEHQRLIVQLGAYARHDPDAIVARPSRIHMRPYVCRHMPRLTS